MANPVFMLVKPLIKAIGKEAAKLIGKEAAKAGTSAGLKAAAKGTLKAVDAINVARAAVDKKMAATIAKSLGMTTKELNALTKALKMTDARKQAVTGKNYLKNINKYLDSPQKTIKQYVKNELKKNLKPTKDLPTGDKKDIKEDAEKVAKRNALTILDGKLKKINPNLSLPKSVWEAVDTLDIDDIFEVMEYLEVDFYYTANNSEPDNPIYLDATHKGYSQGMEEPDFINMVESMLLNGFHSTPIDGII